MEKKNNNNETKIYDDAEKKMMRCLLLLPFDLSVDEILTRMPVKSLARFRCVSKRFLHLLTSDPNFAMRQHELRQRSPSSSALISSRIQPESGTVVIHDLSTSVKGTHALSFSELADCTAVSNPVNGLVACGYETIHRTRPLSRHYLLNPSTREILHLPVTSRDDRWGVIGFGYSEEKSSYKLVRLFSAPASSRIRLCRCEVLTIGTSDWRDIGSALTALPFGQPVSLNGSIHWLASLSPADDSDVVPTSVILTFRVADDGFGLIPVPEPAHQQNIGLGDYGGRLCVTVLNDSNSWNIWVLSDSKQWTKVHVISTVLPDKRSVSYPRFIGIRDGKLLVQNVANHCFQPVYSYDPRTGAFSLVLASNQASPHLRFYAESLISPASLLLNVT